MRTEKWSNFILFFKIRQSGLYSIISIFDSFVLASKTMFGIYSISLPVQE
nr:hypothetical protein [Escherichia coli O25b:H4-ST131]